MRLVLIYSSTSSRRVTEFSVTILSVNIIKLNTKPTCGNVESLEFDRQQVVDHRGQVGMDVGGCTWVRIGHHFFLIIGYHNTLLAQ